MVKIPVITMTSNRTWLSFLLSRTRNSISAGSWSYQKDCKKSSNRMEDIWTIKAYTTSFRPIEIEMTSHSRIFSKEFHMKIVIKNSKTRPQNWTADRNLIGFCWVITQYFLLIFIQFIYQQILQFLLSNVVYNRLLSLFHNHFCLIEI